MSFDSVLVDVRDLVKTYGPLRAVDARGVMADCGRPGQLLREFSA